MSHISPDHIWTAAWGVGVGMLIAIPIASAAAVQERAAAQGLLRATLVALAVSLSNMTGCVAGFEAAWRLFHDVSAGGIGACAGAAALSALAIWRSLSRDKRKSR